jgi:hypothetical protein
MVAVATPFSLTSEKYPMKTMKFKIINCFDSADKKIYFKPLFVVLAAICEKLKLQHDTIKIKTKILKMQ